jgi:transposase-like protein
MTTPARARYAGYRFPAEIIGHAVWLYFRFPLGLRMVEELLAARGVIVSHETVRGHANLASNSPIRSVVACHARATNGISMRSCSRSPA